MRRVSAAEEDARQSQAGHRACRCVAVSPHVLRHTFATQLIRDGKEPILAELLGHGSLDTTRHQSCPPKPTRPAFWMPSSLTGQRSHRSLISALSLLEGLYVAGNRAPYVPADIVQVSQQAVAREPT
ncbi:site-specific integrase [Nonomuraea sp. NPDC049784]|uniref:site-specific integrase n=1 Tax=Nonomuraea sp. NPDC049784 TaxID=3154361 RepID=UPI0033CAC04F